MKGFLRVPIQFRAEAGEEGIVEGTASAFNIEEPGYRTRFRPGAFRKTLDGRDPKEVKMLLGHEPEVQNLVGVWDMLGERTEGLKVRGHLLMDIKEGHDTYIRAKSGALDSLSVGFIPRLWEDVQEAGRSIRDFLEVDLWEISFVVFRGNPGATLTAVRTALREAQTKREFETALRDVGLSRSDAKYVTSLVELTGEVPDAVARDVLTGNGKANSSGLEAILAALKEGRTTINGG